MEKDDLKNQVFLMTKVGTNNYKVLDQREMRWKIEAERQKIGVWETQRATLEMYGRVWTAWFTTEIPLPDGPYKFHGLPGLIVQISDENENHFFKLKEICKLDHFSPDKNVFESKFIDISQEQYQKIYRQYRKDPVGADIQTMPPGNMVVRNLDGSVVDMNKFRLDRENRLKENVRKNNNPLEFDLLQ